MPVGNVDYSGGLGQGPGIGSLAQLAARLFTRGGGGGQPTAPITGEMLQGAFGIPARRNYLGGAGDVAAAQKLLMPPPPQMAGGPPVPMSKPMIGEAQAGYTLGGRIHGPGDGRSDSVPALVDGQGMAQLSRDEYVIPADVVSALGRGSSAAGAKKLDMAMEQVRAGYASKLKGMPKPKAGGKNKFLGGLFDAKQEQKMELPNYLRDIAGSLPGTVESYKKARPSGVSEIAQFTPDQQAYFARSRQAANDPTGAQAAYQRGQDLLGGIYQGGNPWDDTLIQQSMQDYDRGTAINAAAARRSVAGRGAFGEGAQLAEVEAAQEAARGRGLLGSQLREQGLSRRTQAAQEIGNLAGLERQANIGDVGLLGGIGEIQYGRAQRQADAPWQRVQRISSLLQGAPTSTTSTAQESPLKLALGLGALGAGAFFKSGGRVRAGGRASHRKRAQSELYAGGGMVKGDRHKGGMAKCEHMYADGGVVAPGAFNRIGASPWDAFNQKLDAYEAAGGSGGGMRDSASGFLGRRAQGLSRNWRYLTGGGLGPEPYEESPGTGLSEAAQRVAELVGPPVPNVVPATPAAAPTAPIPIPVSKPARKGGGKKAAPTAVATAEPVLAAPGMAALPARLSSPEGPITAAPPSPTAPGIKVTEAPLPPKPPPADASAEKKQNWFEKWSSNPLTQFGLNLLATPGPLGSAIGRAGIATLAGAAAGRRESREEKRLALADERALAAENRAEREDQRALIKIGLDKEQATQVAADRREQRRQAEERLRLQEQQGQQRLALEQARINATVGHYKVREGQMAKGLSLREQALAKVGATKGGKAAADPNKVQRSELQRALGKLQAEIAKSGGQPTPEDEASLTSMRQAIAALGPEMADNTEVPPPEGAFLDEES
jgi:hypothetical protein